MTRTIGNAKNGYHPRTGKISLEWGQYVAGDGWTMSLFRLDFKNHSVSIYHDESTGKWMFRIRMRSIDLNIYDVTLFEGPDTPHNEQAALDAGSTELMEWFLTEAPS